jgi:SAM-dependent methyltransferase
MHVEECFAETRGCPFCAVRSTSTLDTIQYRETAEANQSLPDVHGALYACESCGVAYCSHVYQVAAFPVLYQKTLGDLTYFDRTALQVLRKAYLKAILGAQGRIPLVARFLDSMSLRVLQVPQLTRSVRGLSVLDVGFGLGEFSAIFEALGSRVSGTEIIPRLVEAARAKGMDAYLGEIEALDLGGRRFDLILMRAVYYRTRDPVTTLKKVLACLAEDGEIALVDPCPGREGASYFFRKQFPQGRFYVIDRKSYFRMLGERFALRCMNFRQFYGRPRSALKPTRLIGNLTGLAELAWGNLTRSKPYTAAYTLRRVVH